MKSIIIHQTNTYPDIIAHVESNSFGDQVIKIVLERRNGTKQCIHAETNHEGNWRSNQDIIEMGLYIAGYAKPSA